MTDNTLQVITKFDAVGTNVKVDSLQDAKVVNLYQEAKPVTPVAAVTQAAVAGNAAEKEVSKEEAKEVEPSRRDALKRISDRERELAKTERLAKEKLAKAEAFHEASKRFEEDPTLIAKAMGMETGEFLKKLQNKVLDIPQEAVKPEDVMQKRLAAMEEQTKKLQDMQHQSERTTYLQQYILPVVTKDPDKFACINSDPAYSAHIYDLIEAHYHETKGKEIWKVEDVAEALEQTLVAEREEVAKKLKNDPILKKYFKDEVEVKSVPTSAPVKTITSSLGANASGGLPNLPDRNAEGTKVSYIAVTDRREARRQATAQAIRQQFPEKFTKNNKK